MVKPDDINLPDFDELCDLLMPLGAVNSPAELHGLLCGKLCGGMVIDSKQWLAIAWDFLNITDYPGDDARDQVTQVYLATEKKLNSGDYNLQPFLPDDDSEMEQRLQALSQWCHGFLTGFGSAGIDPNQQFSGDHADALRDLAAIVQVDLDKEEGRDQEQQEADFADLVEYVRMAAMSIYEEYGAASETSEKTVH
ncbi:MAG: UPF0149 family protein [Pseudomonadota bacterium]